MKRIWLRKPIIVLPMAALVFMLGLCPRGAVMAAPSNSASSATQRYLDARQRNERVIRDVLADEQVRRELAKRGLKAEAIEARLAQLSDAQMQDLASQIEKAKAGGDHVVVVSVGGILLVILIIWLFFWLLDPHHHPHHPHA